MPEEPAKKRVYAFIDGQNLFHSVREAFGYSFPNYDPKALAHEICRQKKWSVEKVFFYTGVPDVRDNMAWNRFWTAKLASMGRLKINAFSRPLRYRNQTVILPDGGTTTTLVGQEKGIDVRIALDIVKFAREKCYDVALVFSQDQDLSEAADEIKSISIQQKRWIRMACTFPISPTYDNRRGINRTEWIHIDRKTYDKCLDPNDYRPLMQNKR